MNFQYSLGIHPSPEMTSEPTDLPNAPMQRYRFRRIKLKDNPTM